MAACKQFHSLRNILAGAALAAFVAMPVAAQPAPGGGQGPAMGQQKGDPELRSAQQKVRDLRQKIGEIQQKAMENSPELQQQRKDLRALVKEKFKAQVDGADKKMARLKEIRKKLQGDEELPKEERQKLMKEYQQIAGPFQKAQRQVMQDPEVKQARDKFKADMRAAMKEEDPNTEQLIQDLQQAQKEFQQKLQERFSGGMRGGGGPGAGQGAPATGQGSEGSPGQ